MRKAGRTEAEQQAVRCSEEHALLSWASSSSQGSLAKCCTGANWGRGTLNSGAKKYLSWYGQEKWELQLIADGRNNCGYSLQGQDHRRNGIFRVARIFFYLQLLWKGFFHFNLPTCELNKYVGNGSPYPTGSMLENMFVQITLSGTKNIFNSQ